MKKSIRLFSLTLVTLLAAGLTACQSTLLLKENFATDAIGYRPDRYISGDPAGDSVAYRDALSPRLSVQPSTAQANHKSLIFSEAPMTESSSADRWIAFKGILADYSKPIQFQWTGKQRNSTGTLLIDVQGPQGLWVTRMKLLPNGQLMRITNEATGDGELLGTLDSTKTHSIFITLIPPKPGSKNPIEHQYTFNIGIFNTREGSDSNRRNLPVLYQPNPKGPVFSFEKPLISFSYMNETNKANPAYVFESVFITRQ